MQSSDRPFSSKLSVRSRGCPTYILLVFLWSRISGYLLMSALHANSVSWVRRAFGEIALIYEEFPIYWLKCSDLSNISAFTTPQHQTKLTMCCYFPIKSNILHAVFTWFSGPEGRDRDRKDLVRHKSMTWACLFICISPSVFPTFFSFSSCWGTHLMNITDPSNIACGYRNSPWPWPCASRGGSVSWFL